MTDFRDPGYRDPNYRDPNYPADRNLETADGSLSGMTWAWIAGIAVVVLVLVFAFGSGQNTNTADTGNPAATTGQGTQVPPALQAPTMNRPATPQTNPAPKPAPAPAEQPK